MDKSPVSGGAFARLTGIVETALAEHSMVANGSRILAAVSGGADSVALLLALNALHRRLGFSLEAAHVEHGIRGQDSLNDARFVEELCERLSIRCSVAFADAPEAARRFGGGLEDGARRVRYEALERIAGKRGIDRVALAHHRLDQAETVLLHIVRGSGVSGLEGMRHVRGMYIRPLLGVNPALLREALFEIGQPWRVDSTNADPRQPRALLRRQVLPLLERINPAASNALARVAELAARDNDYMDEQALSFLGESTAMTPYGAFLNGLYDLREAIASRALRLTPRRLGVEAWESRFIESMLTMDPGSSVNLPEDWTAKRVDGRLHLIAPASRRSPIDLTEPPLIITPAKACEFGDGKLLQTVPRALLDQASWRTRSHGDWWTPFGKVGRQLLSDTLINRKIDEPFRDCVPLLTIRDEVLWAVGVGASERLRMRTDADTGDYIMIRWHGVAPWINKAV
jgi:tRNA(Ile)-lysidine synthase